MIYPLRPYQEKAKTECRQALSSAGGGCQRIILCSPTGSGKTVTFSDIARSAVLKGKRVMILCDRRELIGQAHEKIQTYGLNPTIIAPKHVQRINSSYIASVDTLIRREAPPVDLLIVDEAHKRTFDKVLTGIYPHAKVIGATATPIRPWKASLHKLYDALIEPTTISELITDKYLVPARTIGVRRNLDHLDQKINPESGELDYDQTQLAQEYNKPGMYDGVIENYLKFSKGKKALVFNVNIETSKKMTERFNQAGILSFHIDGKTPDHERKSILANFAAGRFMVLNNCSVFTTGFDEPSIETIIINRSTTSLALFLQMAGRGSRLFFGKDYFTIIDQGGNVFKHGLWQSERKFSLMSEEKKRNKIGAAPVKSCSKCESIISASATKCEFCHYVIPVKEKILMQGEFGELDAETIGTIVAASKGSNTKSVPFWSMTDDEIRVFGAKHGYKPGWAEYKILHRNGGSTYDITTEECFI